MSFRETTRTITVAGFFSNKIYTGMMECSTRSSIDSAMNVYLSNPQQGRGNILLDPQLATEFLVWGRLVKHLSGTIKFSKLSMALGAMTAAPTALLSAYRIYSTCTDLDSVLKREPEFFQCLTHEHYLQGDGTIFIDRSLISTVGAAFQSGKAPWGMHFKF